MDLFKGLRVFVSSFVVRVLCDKLRAGRIGVVVG